MGSVVLCVMPRRYSLHRMVHDPHPLKKVCSSPSTRRAPESAFRSETFILALYRPKTRLGLFVAFHHRTPVAVTGPSPRGLLLVGELVPQRSRARHPTVSRKTGPSA